LILTILSGIYIFFREDGKKKRLGNWNKYYTDLIIGLVIVIALIIWLKCWWLFIPSTIFIAWIIKEKMIK